MKTRFLRFCLSVLLLAAAAAWTPAAFLRDHPVEVRQPDGTVVRCFVTGDEYFREVFDEKGYQVVLDPDTGYAVYGQLGADGGVHPTRFRAGLDDPARAGLMPGIQAAPDYVRRVAGEAERAMRVPAGGGPKFTPSQGQINNVIILMRFSDDSDFVMPVDFFTSVLNDNAAGAVSLKNYYGEVSYGQLDLTSHIFPVPGTILLSYQDSHARGYFQPYSSSNTIGYSGDLQRRSREHALLRDAVAALTPQIPPGLDVDTDNDGLVDAITFVTRGATGAWNSLLWPHAWQLTSFNVTINGATVYSYSFQIEGALYSTQLAYDVVRRAATSVLAHEMFHNIGAPDLYHYDGVGTDPIGRWDLMCSDNAQHMSALMKHVYSDGRWIASIPKITASGTYTLNPLSSPTGNCYRIDSPYSAGEYFVLEYRRQAGTFESGVPGSGLVVYRVNSLVTSGNRNGPPDMLRACRPFSRQGMDGFVSDAFLSAESGRTSLADHTGFAPHLEAGGTGGIQISNVGSAGDTISFYVYIPPCAPPGVQDEPAAKTVAAGATADLSATAAGTGPFTYAWYQGRRGERGRPTGAATASWTTPPVVTDTPFWLEIAGGCGTTQTWEALVSVALPAMPGNGTYRAAGAAVGGGFYVFGGSDAAGMVSRVDRYDTAAGTWATVSSMPTQVRNVQAAVVGSTVYIPGGYNGNTLAILQAFDTSSNTWAPGLAAPPDGLSTTNTACGGKVYCFSGQRSSSGATFDTSYCYDPGTNSWSSALASLPAGEGFTYGSALAVNNFCYMTGGTRGDGSYQRKLWRYDTVRNVWEAGPSLNLGRMSPVMVWLGQYLYVFEGGGAGGNVWCPLNTIERYDLAAWPGGKWDLLLGEVMPTGVAAPVGAALADGTVLLAGGVTSVDSSTGGRVASKVLQRYLPPGLPGSSWITVTPANLGGFMAGNGGLGCGDPGADVNGDGRVNALDLVSKARE